jgi:phage terminase large subunit
MKWLQSLKKIVIDPVRCPHTAREFSTYEYERTPDGEPMSAYPDADNHSIDSVRYGLNPVWRRKGQ